MTLSTALRRAAPLLLLAACEAETPPNVVLLSIDTLRADHLGCYGYERDTSPHLDRLAERSLRYANVVAPAPWTLPSHAAMLTGRHPFDLGVTEQDSVLPAEVPTLAEILSAAGYRTAAFVDSLRKGFVGAARGFDRGFEVYSHAPHARGARYRYDMQGTVDAAVSWLEAREDDAPFFLFLHTKSVHTAPADPRIYRESDAPYHKPAEVRRRFLPEGRERFRWTDPEGNQGVAYLKGVNRRIQAGELDPADFPRDRLAELVGLYDAGIWYVDAELGRLLDELARLELDGNTLVVVTSDHGEAFLDNRLFLHKEVYGAVLRVPLVLHDPRDEGGAVVSEPVSLLDLVPTLLARCGLSAPLRLDGTSLPPADGPPRDRRFYSATGGVDSRAVALQENDRKLVLRRDGEDGWVPELFDPLADPLDQRPLEPDGRAAALARELDAWVRAAGGADELELDQETLDELRALGYGE